MFLVITGLAQESKIAAGPGVSHVVCSGSDPERLRGRLTRLDPTGLRAVISFGIAGGLDPSLHPGDVVVATAVIAETQADDGFWDEARYTATGFPRVFYLRYHGYAKFFPLWALARFRNLQRANRPSTAWGM